jgi:ABC-2 type transport system permease protein
VKLLVSELRLRRTSLIVWVVSVFALVAMITVFYPQIRSDPSLNSIYGNMSPAMQALLGGSNLTSPAGYLNTQVFAFFLPAVLLVFGLGRGSASIAGEEEERTLDLLLAQPVPRWSAYLQKAVAVTIGITVLTLATWVILAALNTPVKFDLPVANLAAVCLQMGIFTLALSLAAQAIAAATGRRGYGLSVVAGYTFVSYVIYGMSATVTWLRNVRPLMLWRWYLLNNPLVSGFSWPDIAVLIGVCLTVLVGGVFFFGRRDLRA